MGIYLYVLTIVGLLRQNVVLNGGEELNILGGERFSSS